MRVRASSADGLLERARVPLASIELREERADLLRIAGGRPQDLAERPLGDLGTKPRAELALVERRELDVGHVVPEVKWLA